MERAEELKPRSRSRRDGQHRDARCAGSRSPCRHPRGRTTPPATRAGRCSSTRQGQGGDAGQHQRGAHPHRGDVGDPAPEPGLGLAGDRPHDADEGQGDAGAARREVPTAPGGRRRCRPRRRRTPRSAGRGCRSPPGRPRRPTRVPAGSSRRSETTTRTSATHGRQRRTACSEPRSSRARTATAATAAQTRRGVRRGVGPRLAGRRRTVPRPQRRRDQQRAQPRRARPCRGRPSASRARRRRRPPAPVRTGRAAPRRRRSWRRPPAAGRRGKTRPTTT